MPLSSVAYAVFLVVVGTVFAALPSRYRWMWLLAASGYFYASFNPGHLIFVLILAFGSYLAARAIERASGRTRLRRLWWSVLLVVSALAVFRVPQAREGCVALLTGWLPGGGEAAQSLMATPAGLSYVVFGLIAYAGEVYHGRTRAERRFGRLALYVVFFPKLLAGPIERPHQFLARVKAELAFDYDRAASGLRLIAWGLVRKLVIADQLGTFVDAVYGAPRQYSGFALWLATYMYAVQVYCDFAGYTDIARGTARLLGVPLVQNFRQPYFSSSVPEFWRRWHISLMTWLREYVWWNLVKRVPLDNSVEARLKRGACVLAVFLVSALWHGWGWTFVVWGLLHGGYMVATAPVSRLVDRVARVLPFAGDPRARRVVGILVTFNLVCLAWIFFRASSLDDACYIVSHLFTDLRVELRYGIGLGVWRTAVICGCFAAMEVVQLAHRRGRLRFAGWPPWLRWTAYAVTVLAVLLFGKAGSDARFIYVRF